jgi:hypothetical protein
MRILDDNNSPKRKSRIALVEHKSGLLKTNYDKYQEKNFGHAERHGIFMSWSLIISLLA